METLKLILEHLIPLIFVILTPIAVYFTHRLIRWLEEKTGYEISADQKAQLENLILQGVAYAEQIAANRLKATGEKTDSQKKLDMALSFIGKAIENNNLPDKTADELIRLIEARLGTGKVS